MLLQYQYIKEIFVVPSGVVALNALVTVKDLYYLSVAGNQELLSHLLTKGIHTVRYLSFCNFLTIGHLYNLAHYITDSLPYWLHNIFRSIEEGTLNSTLLDPLEVECYD